MQLISAILLATAFFAFNDDDTHPYGDPATCNPQGFGKYLDEVCRGPVTDFFIAVNAQRAVYSSKVFDPAWKYHEDDSEPRGAGYARNLRDLERATGKTALEHWIDACRVRRINCWLSMRMNDVHDVNEMDAQRDLHSDFWRNHPEWWVKPEALQRPGSWSWRALDYSHPQVYEYNLNLVRELVTRFESYGIEIDWMRGPGCLHFGRERELAQVLTDFMREVRAAADAASQRRGVKVRVAVRLPSTLRAAAAYGLQVEEWAKRGYVDLVTACNHNACSDFLLPYREWHDRLAALNPAVKVVAGTDSGLYLPEWCPGEGYPRRLMNRAEIYGWADAMRAEGANDFYLFNLWENPKDSDIWNEVLAKGFPPELLAASTRRYFVSYLDTPGPKVRYVSPTPAKLQAGFDLKIRVGTPPQAGDRVSMFLAFDGEVPSDLVGRVRLNEVAPLKCAVEPRENWLLGLRANQRTVKAIESPKGRFMPSAARVSWRAEFPAGALRRGLNSVRLAPAADAAARLMVAELEVVPQTLNHASK